MKLTNLFIASFIALFLAGCFEKKEETKTVEYYEKNHEERDAVIDKCKNNPGELRETPNCINAIQSIKNESSGSISNFHFGGSDKNKKK